MERAILLDSTVVIYALGIDSRWRDACRALLSKADDGAFRLYGSVEMIQEVVHHRLRRTGDRQKSAAQGRYTAALCTTLHFDREVLDLSLELIERHPRVRGRDAVHLATAMAYGIERIASTDHAFDGIPGITRVDPLEFS